MKHTAPATPPATMASICFCAGVMNSEYTAVGVSMPTAWPKNRNRMPAWNITLAQPRLPLRSIWLESLFQVYWSRSKRARLPIRKTARQMYG